MFQIWMFVLLDAACLRSAIKLVKIQETCYDFCRYLTLNGSTTRLGLTKLKKFFGFL